MQAIAGSVSDNTKIGVFLMVLGTLFLWLGVMFLFDSVLLGLGNVLFLSGFVFVFGELCVGSIDAVIEAVAQWLKELDSI